MGFLRQRPKRTWFVRNVQFPHDSQHPCKCLSHLPANSRRVMVWEVGYSSMRSHDSRFRSSAQRTLSYICCLVAFLDALLRSLLAVSTAYQAVTVLHDTSRAFMSRWTSITSRAAESRPPLLVEASSFDRAIVLAFASMASRESDDKVAFLILIAVAMSVVGIDDFLRDEGQF
jgi:hypothetical protein